MSKLRTGRRLGLPPGAAALGAGLVLTLLLVVVLATGERGRRLVEAGRGLAESRFASLGLRIGVVHLQGASRAAQAEILAAAAVQPGAPILGVDLDAVRRRVEGVGWVKSARVIRLFPDTLVIAVVQRPLMAVWQHGGRTVVVAANGAVAGGIDPGHFARLPLIVGAGANVAARPILAAIAARPRLAARLAALVRVDQRRWDLRLADGAAVSLPPTGEEAALKRLDALDATSRILDLRFARIDLRDPEMIVVRPRGASAPTRPGEPVK